MAEPVDAAGISQLAVRLGLVDDATVRELMFDLGNPNAPAHELVRMMERKGILTPLQSQKLMKGDTDGYILGGYRLLYKISSGTFGRVYRGDNPGTGEIVAVKVLRRRMTEDAKRIESFEREGRIGMTLQHPNIVRILSVSKDAKSGQHYIVMEFVEGDNLKNVLQIRGKIDVDESLRIMADCAGGLAYASSRGLSHRDIKASNILLGTDRNAKLVDFGLAGINEGGSVSGAKAGEETQADRTVDYAGLEKATGVKQGDARSDIYFLGHVLFEMIAGEPLMPPTKDKNARMQRRRFEDVETTLPVLAKKHNIPAPALRVISKALSLDPSKRYQTPAAFQEALLSARAELSGEIDASAHRRATGPLTVYIVEGNAKLQNVFREKFKKLGFKVLMSLDGDQAVKRYQTQPYHALIIDAGTAGRDGVNVAKRVAKEATSMHLDLGIALILNEDQTTWETEVEGIEGISPLVRPITMGDLSRAIAVYLPELQKPQADTGGGEE